MPIDINAESTPATIKIELVITTDASIIQLKEGIKTILSNSPTYSGIAKEFLVSILNQLKL